MNMILMQEITTLQTRVVRLALEVEARIKQSLQALAQRDADAAQALAESDDVIDRQEVAIEEECLKLLALHQPVASDLRMVVAVLKINNDLERIADIAVNIAERVPRLASTPPSGMEQHLQRMGAEASAMLRRSFDALSQRDSSLAREVLARDEILDELHRQTFKSVEEGVVSGPPEVATLLLFLSISRDLERVGDHVTNIAEDLIYLFEGAIIRHAHHLKTERP